MDWVPYQFNGSLPGFALEFPADWQLQPEASSANEGACLVTSPDGSAQFSISWGPLVALAAELEELSTRYARHEVVSQRKFIHGGDTWAELNYDGWKTGAAHADRTSARFTRRSGIGWRIGYTAQGQNGLRRRPQLEAMLAKLHFSPHGGEETVGMWRTWRYMAGDQEFAFNYPTGAGWDVVPDVKAHGVGSCMVSHPMGFTFSVHWGPGHSLDQWLDEGRDRYQAIESHVSRRDLPLRTAQWDELILDSLPKEEVSRNGWDQTEVKGPCWQRERWRFAKNGDLAYRAGYVVPDALRGCYRALLDRMLASVRILGLSVARVATEPPASPGVVLELGYELLLMGIQGAKRFEPMGERLRQEIHALRAQLAYDGLLLPHVALKENSEIPDMAYRLKLGGATILDRDLSKGMAEPLICILEDVRAEAPRIDTALSTRIARPDLVVALFPQYPKAYEHLRTKRPELNLPAMQA